MKILFICGSLEPGRDGVGDYTRRLAAECIRQGVDCRIVALNDRHASSSVAIKESQCDGETKVECLRLPAAMQWRGRIGLAEEWRCEYSPDLVSLQYVPHSFHQQGLPFRLINLLSELPQTIRWHVMLHELWDGYGGVFSMKRNAVSLAQRCALRRLINSLAPTLVTTSNHQYRARLSGDVQVLPLFGNIDPVFGMGDNLLSADEIADDGRLHAVVFGTFSSDQAGFDQQLQAIEQLGQRLGQQPILNLLGRRPDSPGHIDAAKKRFGRESVVNHGPLSGKDLSSWFRRMHIGISRSDAELFAKSGSTLALLEHGLPVLLRGPRILTPDLKKSSYRDMVFFCEDDRMILPPRGLPTSRLAEVARRFLEMTSCRMFEKPIQIPNKS